MKIGYFSDLHTEFLRPDVLHNANPNPNRIKSKYEMQRPSLEAFARMLGEAYRDADVIVAAGDIGTGVNAVGFLRMAFPDKPVIYVPGNHDFWGGEYFSLIRKMREAAEGSNIHFFHNGGTIEINGVAFCAGTLWTDYALFDLPHDNMMRAAHAMNDFYNIEMQDPEQRKYRVVREAMWEARDVMNDHRKIRVRKNGARLLDVAADAVGELKKEVPRRLIPQDILFFHKENLLNIKNAMAETFAMYKKLVVVSHHAPSRISLFMGDETEDDYVYQKHDPFYASNLDHLMEQDDAPALWIHGHTHVSTAYQVGGTRVVSNPKGYEIGEDTGWVIGRLEEV